MKTKFIIENEVTRVCANVVDEYGNTFYIETPIEHDTTDDILSEQKVRDAFYDSVDTYDELGNEVYYGDITVTLLKE